MTYDILYLGYKVGSITTYSQSVLEDMTEKGYVMVWDGKQ